MNKTIGIIVAILVIVLGAYLIMGKPADQTTQEQQSAAQGRVVFSVTDATADMQAISEINMEISKVEMHSMTDGWVTVSSTPRTYSLLQLNAEDKDEFLADINQNTGTYDQVRLGVKSVAVITKSNGTKIAKLPSGELKINAKVIVEANKTSSVNFDFLADKSLHTTGSGEYIFAPVVKTESKSNAAVTLGADSSVSVAGGRMDDTNTVGMDVDGSVKLNFQIDSSKKLNLDNNGTIKVDALLNN